MKKIIFSAAVLAMAAIGAIKATETNDYAFNELQMENVEALAKCEWAWDDCDQPCKANPDCLCYVQGCPSAKEGEFYLCR